MVTVLSSASAGVAPAVFERLAKKRVLASIGKGTKGVRYGLRVNNHARVKNDHAGANSRVRERKYAPAPADAGKPKTPPPSKGGKRK
jgi:hypothetical protein